MPIREGEQFCSHFLGESEAEANDLLVAFDKDLTMLSNKVSNLTGVDRLDLKQEGIIGLARARRDFEEGRGAAFRTLALYKIKDALREWVTKAGNMRVPQYLKDAARLVDSLQKALEKGMPLQPFMSYTDIWRIAKTFSGDESIAKEIQKVRDSIENLASRSHTTPFDLLERAEITPTLVEIPEGTDMFMGEPIGDEEESIVEKLSVKSSIGEIKKILTATEYELIYAMYAEGKTERELEKEFNVKAPTIAVRLRNVLAKVRQNSERILNGTNERYTKKVKTERSVREIGEDN